MCKFVSVPDVISSDGVGNARRTLEVFEQYRHKLDGWNLALVAQDGLEHLNIQWDLFDALFIGGSTEWKLSIHVRHLIKTAQILGKWVHVGRINTPDRLNYFESLGVDSFDGTGIVRYSAMREKIANRKQEHQLALL